MANEADTKKTKDKSKTTVADKNSDAKKTVSNKKSNSKNLPIVPACSDDIVSVVYSCPDVGLASV